MSVDQLPARVREFVNYLDGLVARLDQGGGWCGVFWQRDPEGMQACLDGREVPPWDVVESLLHDLAGQYGPGGAGPETERARALHTGALATYDARPGGRDALGDRLDVMLREQRYAAERQAELGRLLASAPDPWDVDTIRLDLAWARDDHERATARCAELRARMADSDRRAAGAQGQAIRRGRTGRRASSGPTSGLLVRAPGVAGPGAGGPRVTGSRAAGSRAAGSVMPAPGARGSQTKGARGASSGMAGSAGVDPEMAHPDARAAGAASEKAGLDTIGMRVTASLDRPRPATTASARASPEAAGSGAAHPGAAACGGAGPPVRASAGRASAANALAA